MPATPWRLRLHGGISDLADVRRRAYPEDLRRHQRDHEAVDRAVAVEGFPAKAPDWIQSVSIQLERISLTRRRVQCALCASMRQKMACPLRGKSRLQRQ